MNIFDLEGLFMDVVTVGVANPFVRMICFFCCYCVQVRKQLLLMCLAHVLVIDVVGLVWWLQCFLVLQLSRVSSFLWYCDLLLLAVSTSCDYVVVIDVVCS